MLARLEFGSASDSDDGWVMTAGRQLASRSRTEHDRGRGSSGGRSGKCARALDDVRRRQPKAGQLGEVSG